MNIERTKHNRPCAELLWIRARVGDGASTEWLISDNKFGTELRAYRHRRRADGGAGGQNLNIASLQSCILVRGKRQRSRDLERPINIRVAYLGIRNCEAFRDIDAIARCWNGPADQVDGSLHEPLRTVTLVGLAANRAKVS